MLAPVTKFDNIEDQQGMVGTYLYYDTNKSRFIWSGKASGQTLHKRHAQHIKASSKLSPTSTSKFYLSRQSNSSDASRLGWFESLQPVVAFGFFINNVDITKDVLTGGLFRVEEIEKNVRKLRSKSTKTRETKMMMMIGYLMELTYELCLSPHHDISQNPSFESVLRCFASSTKK